MSAKKKDKSEWKVCSGCECFFPRGVCIKHERNCNIDLDSSTTDNVPEQSIKNTLSSDCTGYIKNGKLYGISKYVNRNSTLLPCAKADLVVVHPSALKLCDFQITSSVLIKSKERTTCGVIWPSSSIPVDGVGISKTKIDTLGSSEGSLVTVEIISCPSIIANQVVLDALSDSAYSNFAEIVSPLLHSLNDSSILEGDILSIQFYGEELFYKVVKLAGFLSNDTNNSGVTQQQLGSMLESMSIEDKGNGMSIQNNNEFIYSVLVGSTQLLLSTSTKNKVEKSVEEKKGSDLDKIGGVTSQVDLLRELIEIPFKFPAVYLECGVFMPKGIIVYGVSGTGKTSLVRGFVDSLDNVYCSIVNGPELSSKFLGETEQKLRDIFNKAKNSTPSILILDEFDALCPTRTTSSSDSERRVVATLLTLLDSIEKHESFVVIAITSNLDQVDIALRRPGRLETEIELNVPNNREREDILQKVLLSCKHSLSQEDILELSEITHGYVGSDLNALVKEAGLIAMRTKKSLFEQTNVINKDLLVSNIIKDFSIIMEDFRKAMCNIRVSSMKAVMIDIPKVYWKDIGGQHDVKDRMKEAIEWPLKHPDAFKRLGIRPSRGLLMYGPPGCSKTLIAKALATESGLNFISIKGPELFNKYLGESERAIREVFHKARVSAPSIVFFDEIDAVGVQRSQEKTGNNASDRVLAQLLTELDGVESLEGVLIIAATNRPDIIDPALLRPGRIDHLVYVPLPDDSTRKEIFAIQFRSIPVSEDVDIDTLVALSKGYSGAEICSLCREAAMSGLREDFECAEVSLKHFQTVFEKTKPGITKESIDFYERFTHKVVEPFR